MATTQDFAFGVLGDLKGPSDSVALHHKYAPAGSAFLRCMAVAHGINEALPSKEEEAPQETPVEEEEAVPLKQGEMDDENYYHLLGLSHISFSATQEQIKKAYRKQLMIHHPDKVEKGDQDPMFLRIQKAYDVLSDQAKKRGYDSQLDFDDRIPKGTEDFEKLAGGFYGLYGPTFEANGRFSENRPVPSLGDAETPHAEVTAFYNFWMRFESWRDFSANDEHDASEADSRDERRWMQQENIRGQKKLKKTECSRIRKLVDRAQAADPRIAEIRRLAREEKQKRQNAKTEARNAKANAAKAQMEAEAAAKKAKEDEQKAERATEKAVRTKEKKMRRKVRIGLTKLGAAAKAPMDEDDLAFLVGRLSISACTNMLTDIGELAPAIVLEAAAKRLKMEQSQDESTAAAAAAEATAREVKRLKEEAVRKAMKNIPWTEAELSMLARGLKKFPGGTRYRWKHIAQYINTLPDGNTRAPKDCIQKTTAIKNGTGSTSVDSNQAFKNFSSTPKAEQSVEWTVEQQKALQAGMKNFPSSMPKRERWTAIANSVAGKTLKDCIARVKAIRAKLQKR